MPASSYRAVGACPGRGGVVHSDHTCPPASLPTMHAAFLASLAFVPAAEAAAPTYEAHVRPILKAYCFECHGEGKSLKGGLDLRLRRFLVDGGDSGPAVVPGKPQDS